MFLGYLRNEPEHYEAILDGVGAKSEVTGPKQRKEC